MPYKDIAPLTHKAPMLRVLLLFVFGIVLADLLPRLSLLAFAALWTVTVALALVLLPVDRQDKIGFALVCAFTLLSFTLYRVEFPAKQAPYNFPPKIWGVAERITTTQKGLTRVELRLPGKQLFPDKELIYVHDTNRQHKIAGGDTIICAGSAKQIVNRGNPHEYNFAGNCRRKHLQASRFLRSNELVVLPCRTPKSFVAALNEKCIATLTRYVRDSASLALMKAMIAGDESDIDPDMRNVYADTGVVHVISISGGHVALLLQCISVALFWLRSKRYAKVKLSITLVLAWLYVLMAGAALPALRAAVMFTLVCIGTVSGRKPSALNTLCSAAFIMLFAQPVWLFQAGFQLSFTAVLSLIIFYPPIEKQLKPRYCLLKKLWQGCAVGIAVQILIAPLCIFYFNNFPLMFLPANIFATGLMSVLLVIGMLLLLLSPLPALAILSGKLAVLCTQIFHYILYTLDRVDVPDLHYLHLSLPALFGVYVFVALAVLAVQNRNTKTLLWAMSVLCLLSFGNMMRSLNSARRDSFTVFNFGKQFYAERSFGREICCTDTAFDTRQRLRAHHAALNIHAWQPLHQSVFAVHGKIILLCDKSTVFPKRFPADILVFRESVYIDDVETALKRTGATTVVCDALRGTKSNNPFGAKIILHETRNQGAFVCD